MKLSKHEHVPLFYHLMCNSPVGMHLDLFTLLKCDFCPPENVGFDL